MYILKDNGVIKEIQEGNNFGYVLSDSKNFVSTDYKVLQSQSNGIFVPCMKMMYNGKIELYYITDDFRPMSTMFDGISADILVNVVAHMCGSVVEVRNNGFLQSQNIDISWDKIFVDQNTLKVKLVYLPINVKAFDSYAEFENELRSSLVKLINRLIKVPSERIEILVQDLINGSMGIDDIYNKYKGVGMPSLTSESRDSQFVYGNQSGGNSVLKMVALNIPEHYEVILDRTRMVIGKKWELVDIVVPFNKMISRKHCVITNYNGMYSISDEGSANGTFVNGIRVMPNQNVPIKRGDIIRMADSDFQLV